jgi:hypothetical protein
MSNENGIFEILIQKDVSGQDLDKNNFSPKAFHSYKTFVDSVESLAIEQFNESDLTFDVGTDRVAIKSSTTNIDKLQKSIEDFKENRLNPRNKIYKALHAIEQVISANGITYSAAIRGSAPRKDITTIFKKEILEPEPTIQPVSDDTITGIKFYTGKIKGIVEKKDHVSLLFELDENTYREIVCSPEQVFKLAPKYGQTINIAANFDTWTRRKNVGSFLDEYSDEEFESFYPFMQSIPQKEGRERLKVMYRFFNSYIQRNEISRVVKFAKIFLYENDISMLRVMIDILKQVSDDEYVQDIYNEFILLIKEKIGGSIY